MPKLRNAKTDMGKMAQYLARKCVIHGPQSELDLDAEGLESAPRFGKKASFHKGAKVHMLANRGAPDAEPNEFVALSPLGRAVKVTLEEINPEDLNEELFQKVGN